MWKKYKKHIIIGVGAIALVAIAIINLEIAVEIVAGIIVLTATHVLSKILLEEEC